MSLFFILTALPYFPKFECVLLHAHIRSLLLNEPALPDLNPRVLKPSMLLAYFSVLPTDDHRWEGPSGDMDPRLHFSACSHGVG